ncbi:MAG: hypothetical protein AAF918_02570 [Pseudomonadota bacterium]
MARYRKTRGTGLNRCPPLLLSWVLVATNLGYGLPTFGQDTKEFEQDRSSEIEQVTVQATRLDHQLETYIDPEITFDAAAIRALATSSLAELLEELAPDLSSGRGRQDSQPVVLINGQRVGGFRAIRGYPPESIARVEVYPEAVALQYGFRADQKVINFVLKSEFKATTATVETGAANDGGAESAELEMGHLRIAGNGRWNLSAGTVHSKPLHDADRSIPAEGTNRPFSEAGNLFADEIDPALSVLVGEPVSSATLPADTTNLEFADLVATANQPIRLNEQSLRTLIPAQTTTTGNASYATSLWDGITLNLAADYVSTTSRADLGALAIDYVVPNSHPKSPFSSDVVLSRGFPLALERRQDTRDLALSSTLNGSWNGWSYNWINRFSRARRTITTERRADISAFAEEVASGDPETNPFSGPSVLSLESDRDTSENQDLSSELLARGVLIDTVRGPIYAATSVGWQETSRDTDSFSNGLATQAALTRRIGTATATLDIPLLNDSRWGELSANGNAALNTTNDFDTLATFGAGLTWRPNPALRITSAWTKEETAPAVEQLIDPISRQPNRRLFDFANGASVSAVLITGGNPGLNAEERQVYSLGARYEPFDEHDLLFNFNFVDSETRNPVQRFPTPSPDAESAFPDRFIRDSDGRLVEFDSRPVNFNSEHRQELRWGFRYTRSLGQQSKRRSSGRGTRRGARGPRLRLALNHAAVLNDELTIAAGLPSIDYVGVNNGTRQRGGSEHEVTLRGSYTNRGFAARLNAVWLDRTDSLPNSGQQLSYDDLTRVDLDLVYSFQPRSPWVRRFPWLRSTRVKLSLENLFDEHPVVQAQDGTTPAGFSQDELDPQGRTIALEFRKMFR